MAAYGAPTERNIGILQALYFLNKEQRRAILRSADCALVRCICECALNVLRGNVQLSPLQKQRLRQHAAKLRRLVDKRGGGGWEGKRRLIVKHSAAYLRALLGACLLHIKNGAR